MAQSEGAMTVGHPMDDEFFGSEDGSFQGSDLRFSSTAHMVEPLNRMPKRAVSYQEINAANNWNNAAPKKGSEARRHFLKDEPPSVEHMSLSGGKRTAKALETKNFVRPGSVMLRGNEDGFSDGTSPGPSTPSALGQGGEPIDKEERRQRRLARNRASARMRRLKKKTMADRLDLEVEDLQRSIAFLRVLESCRNSHNGPKPKLSQLSRSVLECAFEASKQPVNPNDEQELIGRLDGSKTGVKKQSDKEKQQLASDVREQLIQLSVADLRELALQHLGGNKSQDNSIHVIRRNAAAQLFLDSQITLVELIRSMATSNSALYVLLAAELNVTEQGAKGATSRTKKTNKAFLDSTGIGVSANPSEEDAQMPMENTRGATQTQKAVGIDPLPEESSRKPRSKGEKLSQQDRQAKMRALQSNLAARLNLSAQQRQQIAQLGHGLQKEQLCCQALLHISLMLSLSKWMNFPTIEQVQDGFRGVLLANQLDKFSTWSKRNIGAINALEITPRQKRMSSLS